jgi:uncharacterized UPF0160 family protein
MMTPDANRVRIVTHAGPFHADELFAAAVLTGLFRGAIVERRTRIAVEAAIAAGSADFDFAVDVGGQHEPEVGWFDHHQRGFAERRATGLGYASFGLVWRHHGEAWCRSQRGVREDEAASVAARMDTMLVAGIDAVDTGAGNFAAELSGVRGPVSPVTVSHLVAWRVPRAGSPPAAYDRAFRSLLPWARRLLKEACILARDEERAAAAVRKADDGSPLLVLPRLVPWFSWVGAHHLLVIYPGDIETPWCVQCVGRPDEPMRPKQPLPEAWAGLRGEQLARVTGVPGVIFCHSGRWLVGARTLDDARRLAELALG